MTDQQSDTYGKWIAFRLCAGYGQNAGNWGAMFQEKPGADVHVARYDSGRVAAYKRKGNAEVLAQQLNNEGFRP